MKKNPDYSSDVIESYTKINGIGIDCTDCCVEIKNDFDRLMDGTYVRCGKSLIATIECDDATEHLSDLLSTENLFNVVNKTFYRNGNIIRIEIKDALLNSYLSDDGNLVFGLSHTDDDNTIVEFY